jgi:fatty-acid desaturase
MCLCCAVQWWQLDVGYYFICLLGMLGLAWDIKQPSEADKARKRKQTPPTAKEVLQAAKVK